MVSPSRLEASTVTKEAASIPSIDKSSKQSATSTLPVSCYRLGTAAMMLPNPHGNAKALGSNSSSSTPSARTLPEHILSPEDNNHNSPESAGSATYALTDGSSNLDSASSSVKATDPHGVELRPSSSTTRKTPRKRPRADSNASSATSSEAAVVPAKKRGRSNALMRSAPRATCTTTPGGLAGNSEFMNFTATIFIIQLGPDGPQFHAHESVLKRSPKLVEEIDKAKANKRATKQNTLPLMTHDAIAFEQMLQFLYKDKFLLSKNKVTPNERLGEFKEIMSLAKHYVLPGLQKQVVKLFSSSKIVSKIPPGQFFDWAEDMYYEELDHENGPFKLYLSKVAPTLMKEADEATRKELVRMVKNGGGFAEQLFIAVVTALDVQANLAAVKKEEVAEQSTPIRPRANKVKEMEPVRQNLREETLDTPGDESMEDSDNLFVQH